MKSLFRRASGCPTVIVWTRGTKAQFLLSSNAGRAGFAFPGVNAVQDDNDVLESSVGIDQKTLVKHTFPTDRSVLVNGQIGQWWRLTVEYGLSADAAALLNCDFPGRRVQVGQRRII